MYDTTKPYKEKILKAIRSTWDSPYARVFSNPKLPYPLIEPTHGCTIEVDHTDGIGTKGETHAQFETYEYAVQDAMAMNLNDLLTVRARPYKLQNHLSVRYENHRQIECVIKALVEQCRKRNIIMTGGETSIMANLSGMDLSITVTGFCTTMRGSEFQTGDELVGLPSSGIHSNGWTMFRKLYTSLYPDPTIIYWDDVFPLLDDINGMIHVAGGGFWRLKEALREDQTAHIDRFTTLNLFHDIYSKADKIMSVKDKEESRERFMYTTFNCGIGMILSAPPEIAAMLCEKLKGQIIGRIVDGAKKVYIESAFDKKKAFWL